MNQIKSLLLKLHATFVFVFLGVSSFVNVASAQMMGDMSSCSSCSGGMGLIGMILGTLVMLSIVAVLLALAYYLVRRSRDSHSPPI